MYLHSKFVKTTYQNPVIPVELPGEGETHRRTFNPKS